MHIHTSRFGELNVSDNEVFVFENGLLGFEEYKHYTLMPVSDNPALYWLQSLDEGDLAFLLVDPFLLVPGYQIELSQKVLEQLAIDKREDAAVYTTVTVPPSGFKDATTNLLGPLVFNPRSQKGMQYVLEHNTYQVKYPLFSKVQAKAKVSR